MVTTICYLLGMFTRKWIKDLPIFKIKLWFTQEHLVHRALQSDQVICGGPGNAHCALCGRDRRALQLQSRNEMYFAGVLLGSSPSPLSPLAMIRQEAQSEPTCSKCENS